MLPRRRSAQNPTCRILREAQKSAGQSAPRLFKIGWSKAIVVVGLPEIYRLSRRFHRRHIREEKMSSEPSEITRAVSTQLQALLVKGPSQQSLEAAYRLMAKWRSHLIENTLIKRQGTRVHSGPFAGMEYPLRVTEGARPARLLGCYEVTLHPVINEVVERDYPLVIDVGSAEGYYAVGLACRMPNAKVVARDADRRAQQACQHLAEINGVADRVEIGGKVTHADFDMCLGINSVVICDIEGAEADLLDPEKARGLREADILVEVHDCFKPGLSDEIAGRFSSSHSVTTLPRRVDMAALPDWMEALSDLDRLTALWEWRLGPTPWLWMKKNGRS